MTYNKMLRELEALIEKFGKDFEVFKYIDTWTFVYEGDMGIRRTDTFRDIITLGDVYEQFLLKTGIYDIFKITSEFRKFIKIISKPNFEPFSDYKFYQDSYDKFHEEWNKLHPEKTYEEYEKEIRRKNENFLNQFSSLYLEPYRRLMRNVYM